MDASLFSDKKTGQILPINVSGQKDFAFIPAQLPPSWAFPTRLWPLLAKAKETLARLDGIGRTLPDPQLLLRPLQQNEAIASSKIEGTYATPQELMLFELTPKESRSEGNQANDWLEVANYNEALSTGQALLGKMPFCLRLAKELHGCLLRGVRGRTSNPGEFRQFQVAIGSDRRYVPPPASHLDESLSQLEAYMNAEDPAFDSLVRAYLVHYQFEAIHPFSDGNGRIGRVLLSLMISKWCGMIMPWLYMSAFFDRYKDEYVGNLFQVSATGGWEKWIEFCLTGTVRQGEDAIRRIEKLYALRMALPDRVKRPTSRTHRIILGLFSNPIVQVASMSRKYHVTYPTAQDDIDRLVESGVLAPLEGVRPKSFFAPEIFHVAYGRDEAAT